MEIFNWFAAINPFYQAFIASLFTWSVTALGAAGVFFVRKPNQSLLDAMLGFAGGIMVAASFWSLLAPSIELSSSSRFPWAPAAIGFLLGAGFLYFLDKVLPHLHLGKKSSDSEGIKTSWHKTVLLFLAVTLHNIPEGLAIGVAFGAVAHQLPGADLLGAIALTIGIGIQNFPEGFAVSMPFQREGLSKSRSFFLGQASALVEPVAALVGAVAVGFAQPILPYALAFAAGSMIFVTVEEIIPESQQRTTDLPSIGFVLGFVIMMILDVALG